MEDLTALIKHIEEVLKEVSQMTNDFSNTKTFSHYNTLSMALAPYGILGALREKSEQKKLRKFLETKIYKNMSFDEIGDRLVELARDLCESQAKVQHIISSEDEAYYGNVRRIIDNLEVCYKKWFDISPKVAMEELHYANGDTIQLGPQIEYWMQLEYIKMDLPEEYKRITKAVKKVQKGGSGCVILLFLLSSSLLTACCLI